MDHFERFFRVANVVVKYIIINMMLIIIKQTQNAMPSERKPTIV